MGTPTAAGRIRSRRVRRLAGAVFLTLALTAVAGCGDDTSAERSAPTTDAPTTDVPSASAEATAAAAETTPACADAARTVEYAERVDPRSTLTSTSLGADLAEAADFFAATPAPGELAEEWKVVGDLLTTLAKAFEGIEQPTQQQIEDAATTLGADITAKTEAAMGAAKSIAAHFRSTCDLAVDATDDPCALLSEAELGKVFGKHPIPEAEERGLGAGFAGCDWEIDEDDMAADDFAVHVTLMPTDALHEDYLSKMKPTGDVPGLGDGHRFDGSVTLGGGSTRGHSVSFSAGDTGGFVSVQKGNDGAAEAEIALAVEFATSVRRQLR